MAQRSEPRRLRVTPRLGTNERNLPADPWPTSPPLPLWKNLSLRSPLPLPRLKDLRSYKKEVDVEVLHLASVAYSEIVEVLHLAASGMVVVVRVAASEMVLVLVYIAFCVGGWLPTPVQVFSVLA